jgi:hypothetical protein
VQYCTANRGHLGHSHSEVILGHSHSILFLLLLGHHTLLSPSAHLAAEG